MQSVSKHYEDLLAQNYTWMLGDDIEATARGQRALLEKIGIAESPGHDGSSLAIDIGCGSGAQALALADLGFATVVGVDSDEALLAELRVHAADRPEVRTVRDDGVHAVEALTPASVDTLVCMGDTVLHLPTKEAVERLIVGAATALRPGGSVVLTYRDLTRPLEGVDRFIPVRSSEDRIMLCFLDYAADDVVAVHDVIYTHADGGWEMQASSYPKLRLAPAWIIDRLSDAGLQVTHHQQQPSGIWATVAQRPEPPAIA
jgi:SAM-dependent methyltransferase